MTGTKTIEPMPAEREEQGAHPSDYWFVVAVDSSGWGFIVDAHPDASAYDMIDGTSCEDNGIEYPDDPGLYRLTELNFTTSKDWDTGIVDEWSWGLGKVEVLWKPAPLEPEVELCVCGVPKDLPRGEHAFGCRAT